MNVVAISKTVVEQVPTMKFIVFYIYENLTYKTQLTSISKKLYKFLPLKIKKKYVAFFLFFLTVWGHASIVQHNSVITIQKNILRLLFGADRKTGSIESFR